LTIKIGSYEFEGPYFSIEQLKELSGVFVILCPEEGKFSVIDVGEASKVRSTAVSRGRTGCWQKNSPEIFLYAAYYAPNLRRDARVEIEREIRHQYEPPCGGPK